MAKRSAAVPFSSLPDGHRFQHPNWPRQAFVRYAWCGIPEETALAFDLADSLLVVPLPAVRPPRLSWRSRRRQLELGILKFLAQDVLFKGPDKAHQLLWLAMRNQPGSLEPWVTRSFFDTTLARLQTRQLVHHRDEGFYLTGHGLRRAAIEELIELAKP